MSKIFSHVLKGLGIKGKITGHEDLIVDGNVDGPINLARGALTITEKATVKGYMSSRKPSFTAPLNDNLQAQERVKILTWKNGSWVLRIVSSVDAWPRNGD